MAIDIRTPTGRPLNYPARIRAFITECINDGRVDGKTQEEFVAMASQHLQHEILINTFQGQLRSMGLNWYEVSNRAMRDAVKTIITSNPEYMTVIEIQEALASQGISVIHRTLARHVASVRVELQRDKGGGQ